jgi:pentatricopeptide repeat protein
MPTDATILCGMKACSNVGALGRGHKIHAEIEKKGWLEEDVRMGSSVVDMYAKCGSLETAHAVFNRIPARDVVIWNSLISGYAEHGTCENVFWIFNRMFAEGVKPDMVTFLVTLNACNRAGTVSKSERLFEAMSRDFGICPSVEHHTGMVGLLCRIGCMDLALSAIRRMRCCPNLVLWRSVLAACRKFGDVRFGERAFRCAMQAGMAKDAASI